ncbi:MAG: hypothetical protein QF437_12155 [Planctomycetota bacterium]|jgi:hypothetical protein|nr:hypothetical protein [Planctomycetota bacterium]MDP7131238.1 hypothetical protein [Planctomycetota bacterium]MDP7248229.1 hypothetical protein [Planctomycetota bacterium]
MQAHETLLRNGGEIALQNASRFFMKDDPVHHTLKNICGRLQDLDVDYAVVGGMALVAHGYIRTTVDVDILLNQDGLKKAHDALEGLGYRPPFEGSKNLRDTQTGVRIEFLVSGGYPGDGKPKPVIFPEPSDTSVVIDGISYLSLNSLLELKLASGMTNPGRIRDLADVQELIRTLELPEKRAEELNPFVREKFVELWAGIH